MSAKYRVFEVKVQAVKHGHPTILRFPQNWCPHENYRLHCLLNANGSLSPLGSEKQSFFHKGYCPDAWGLGKAWIVKEVNDVRLLEELRRAYGISEILD